MLNLNTYRQNFASLNKGFIAEIDNKVRRDMEELHFHESPRIALLYWKGARNMGSLRARSIIIGSSN